MQRCACREKRKTDPGEKKSGPETGETRKFALVASIHPLACMHDSSLHIVSSLTLILFPVAINLLSIFISLADATRSSTI